MYFSASLNCRHTIFLLPLIFASERWGRCYFPSTFFFFRAHQARWARAFFSIATLYREGKSGSRYTICIDREQHISMANGARANTTTSLAIFFFCHTQLWGFSNWVGFYFRFWVDPILFFSVERGNSFSGLSSHDSIEWMQG